MIDVTAHKDTSIDVDFLCGSLSDYQFCNNIITMQIKLADDSISQLLYPCQSESHFEVLQPHLKEISYWRVYYKVDTRKITRMEQVNDCVIL